MPHRAEAIAHSIADPEQQARALRIVANVAAEGGDAAFEQIRATRGAITGTTPEDHPTIEHLICRRLPALS